MNRDEVTRLAEENGIVIVGEAMVRFANLAYVAGAAAEREECAKVCEGIEMQGHALWDRTADPEAQGRSIAASDCADAIRARGEK